MIEPPLDGPEEDRRADAQDDGEPIADPDPIGREADFIETEYEARMRRMGL